MEESRDLERLKKWIRMASKGEVSQEAEAEAVKGIRVVKLHKGFVLCDYLIHHGVSDRRGKWHGGAMVALMDTISSWTAFSFTSRDHITLHLSLSYYSNPSLQEVVEVEGKAMGERGRMTSVRVEVRS